MAKVSRRNSEMNVEKTPGAFFSAALLPAPLF